MRTKVAATFLVIRCFFAILSPMALQTRKIVPNSKKQKSPTPEPQKPLQHLHFSHFSVGIADRCNSQKSPKGDFAYSCKKIRRENSVQKRQKRQNRNKKWASKDRRKTLQYLLMLTLKPHFHRWADSSLSIFKNIIVRIDYSIRQKSCQDNTYKFTWFQKSFFFVYAPQILRDEK